MANIKSQKKRIRTNEKRRVRNKAVRTELKTRVKTAQVAIDGSAEDATDRVQAAQKRLAMAASKGVLHPNQASRRISRLMRRAAHRSADQPS